MKDALTYSLAMSAIYDIEVTTIDGETRSLERYRGDVMLIVNTASR